MKEFYLNEVKIEVFFPCTDQLGYNALPSFNKRLLFLQISVILDGTILMVFVTLQVKLVQTGPQHCKNVDKKTPSLLMSAAMKRMCTCSIDTMVQSPGWG